MATLSAAAMSIVRTAAPVPEAPAEPPAVGKRYVTLTCVDHDCLAEFDVIRIENARWLIRRSENACLARFLGRVRLGRERGDRDVLLAALVHEYGEEGVGLPP